jgi:hypothetical protein
MKVVAHDHKFLDLDLHAHRVRPEDIDEQIGHAFVCNSILPRAVFEVTKYVLRPAGTAPVTDFRSGLAMDVGLSPNCDRSRTVNALVTAEAAT